MSGVNHWIDTANVSDIDKDVLIFWEIRRMRIVKNCIKCLKCGEVIESVTRHDFKGCSCGAVCVDGGKDYLRRCGYPEDYVDLSVVEKDNSK